MSDSKQSYGENQKGNRYDINRSNFYRRYIAPNIDAEQSRLKSEERAKQRLEEQGNGKHIMAGSNDRVEGKPYDGNNDQKYPTQDDKKSYYFGYVTHGGRRIDAIIYKLEKEEKYDEIMALGYREAELGLTEKQIGLVEGEEPMGLAKYAAYMEGYNAAKKSTKARK